MEQNSPYQHTLRKTVTLQGIGLHSGHIVTLRLLPAAADHGIVFKRTDIKGKSAYIPARYDLVTDTRLGTRLTNKHGVSISTVEHLMAALWGAGVDNALIELDAAEVPIMDGSSEPFLHAIAEAGVIRQQASRKIIRILAPVLASLGESTALVESLESDELTVQPACLLDVTIDFPHALIARQRAIYDFTRLSFQDALSRARTFCFEREVEAMRSVGLGLGGSLDNAIVIGEEGVLNKEGLRYTDEFIRHKALDCIGDLYLAGYRIEGRFTFSRPGHGINNAILRALFADSSAWKLVSAPSETSVHTVDHAQYAFA